MDFKYNSKLYHLTKMTSEHLILPPHSQSSHQLWMYNQCETVLTSYQQCSTKESSVPCNQRQLHCKKKKQNIDQRGELLQLMTNHQHQGNVFAPIKEN